MFKYSDKRANARGSRHDFDFLPPSNEIQVRPAVAREVELLAQMGQELVPGIEMHGATLSKYSSFDPETLLTFTRHDRLLGGMAFLYLNAEGHDALILDRICLTEPEFKFLARPNEDVAAIYIWAIGAHGRALAGLGNVVARFRERRFAGADYFAQPSSAEGRQLMIATGFEQTPSFQPDLWTYQRPWNRLPGLATAPQNNLSEGVTHARH